jgi:thimet oligopeptidase
VTRLFIGKMIRLVQARSGQAAVMLMMFIAAHAVGAQGDPSSPIAEALTKANAGIERIVAIPDAQRNFGNTVGALDDILVQLDIDTSMILFMNHVSTDAGERERGALAEEHYNNWIIELGKNESVYKAVRAVADKKPKLEPEAQRLVEHTLRDYRRAGMELPVEQRDELKKIQIEIAKLGIEFERNVRDDETTVPLTIDELKGMDDEFIEALPKSGQLYLVGMDYPIFNPMMDFCESEVGRSKVWLAYKRRGGQKNVNVLEHILKLRAQAAEMLGYRSASDFENEIRMSKNAHVVKDFYDKLRPLVRKKAQQDFDEFLQAKREHTGDPNAKLYPWDQSFYQKKLQLEKYAVDARKVQEYFPMQRATEGLFSITQSLYGLEYKNITDRAKSEGRKFWHPDVQLYEVWDKTNNQLLGEFYLDLYPRENKYGHAAQWGLIQRKKWADGRVERPLAALVCNFTKPTADKPSLLTHDEVETYFHEFGHCLHTILTEANFGRFAGTSVERDFVEAPSQMFENWVWDADVLKTFARHYKTNDPLPDELLQGMIRAKNLGSGLMAEHQFYYGLTDQAYHTAPKGEIDTTKAALDLFKEVELFETVPNHYYQASFGHLIGYQGGYYGYQWSLVYAQDMFQRFKELGMLDPEAGMYYRKKILARGGTVDAMDMIRDYLGREPKMDAYLEHLGLEVEGEQAAKH